MNSFVLLTIPVSFEVSYYIILFRMSGNSTHVLEIVLIDQNDYGISTCSTFFKLQKDGI